MIQNDKKNEICSIWDNYIKSNKTVLDTKGKEIEDIGKLRIEAIVHIKELISGGLLQQKAKCFLINW